MDIKQLLSSALSAARTQKIEAESQSQLHRRRSSIWVECLADQFRTHYEADAAVRVFSKECYGKRGDFGLNEPLHDVCVCRLASVQSAGQRRTTCPTKVPAPNAYACRIDLPRKSLTTDVILFEFRTHGCPCRSQHTRLDARSRDGSGDRLAA